MRLIDADNFKQFMCELEAAGAEYVSFDNLKKFIDEQSTAFDCEHMIKETHETSRKMSTIKVPHTYYRALGTRNCEEIIRKGGLSAKI